MKKILASIILICSVSIITNTNAQGIWKVLYSQSFINLSVSDNYIWATSNGNLLRIRTSDFSFDEMIDSINVYTFARGISSKDNKCWVSLKHRPSGKNILRLYDGYNYTEYNANNLNINESLKSYIFNISNSTLNAKYNISLFFHYNSPNDTNQILYFRNNNFKVINTTKNYASIKVINENTFIAQRATESKIDVIDTNGVVKKTYQYLDSYPNKYIFGLEVDNDGNIYLGVKNIGIVKITYSPTDTSQSLFIPNQNFGEVNTNSLFRYTDNNQFIVRVNSTASIYNINGVYIKNYPFLPTQYNYYFDLGMNITKNDDLVSMNGKQLLRYSDFQLIDMIDYRNRVYEQTRCLSFGENGMNLWGTSTKTYHLNKNKFELSNLNFPNPDFTQLSGSITDLNGKIWALNGNFLLKMVNQETVEEAFIFNNTNLATIAKNTMKINKLNNIQILQRNKIVIFNQNGDTTEIPKSDSILYMYDFTNDKLNNIWVATSNGIASIKNGMIKKSSTVKGNYQVGNITYSEKHNSLIYSADGFLIIYKLDSNKIYEFPLYNILQEHSGIKDLTLDMNGYLWVCTSNIGVIKFDLDRMNWDLDKHFHNKNSFVVINDFDFTRVDANNNKYFIGSSQLVYIYNETGLILSTDDGIKINNKNHINIFPNPSRSEFTIKQNSEITHINIFDLKGKKVYTLDNINSKECKLHLENSIENGLYIIETIDNNKNSIKAKILIKN